MAETIKPYQDEEGKADQVRRMFNRIAPAYDRVNRLMSLGLDRAWRRRAIAMIEPFSPRRVLDIATGTGDLAISLLRDVSAVEEVVGVDLSEGMMLRGQDKVKEEGYENAISFVKADALELPFEDDSFDAITVGFGVRNFEDLPASFVEMRRVMKPGAAAMILELSEPKVQPMHFFYTCYTRRIVPVIGQLLTQDKEAYTYLPRSIKAMPQREGLLSLLDDAGFTETYYRSLFPGTAVIYMAIK